MATRIINVTVTPDPADLFAAFPPGGFGTLRTPGERYTVQNVSGPAIRYARAEVKPVDLTVGFRLESGAIRELVYGNHTTWCWVAAGAEPGRLVLEV